jgi:uncharacterized protein (TIGR00725 family)
VLYDPSMTRRPQVAVIGPHAPSPTIEAAAEAIGRGLVDAGCRIVTGGLQGVMEAASRGARSSKAANGDDVIGILPGLDLDEANPHVEIAIATGLALGRNVLVVASADVVIACGGRAGTLMEIAAAWQLGRPIVALDLDGGWSAEVAGRPVDDRRTEPVVRARSAEEAVTEAVRILATA